MEHGYPRFRYHPDKPAELVNSPEEEKALGAGWYKSPAEYGVETAPSKKPDPKIAENAVKFKKLQQQPVK